MRTSTRREDLAVTGVGRSGDRPTRGVRPQPWTAKNEEATDSWMCGAAAVRRGYFRGAVRNARTFELLDFVLVSRQCRPLEPLRLIEYLLIIGRQSLFAEFGGIGHAPHNSCSSLRSTVADPGCVHQLSVLRRCLLLARPRAFASAFVRDPRYSRRSGRCSSPWPAWSRGRFRGRLTSLVGLVFRRGLGGCRFFGSGLGRVASVGVTLGRSRFGTCRIDQLA